MDQGGYSLAQASGIVGNLISESGVNPQANQPGGPGMGIAQWSEGQRWSQLTSYAHNKGENPFALSTQVDFLMVELNTTEAKSKKKLLETTTPEAAAGSFLVYNERAADTSAKAQAFRGKNARFVYDEVTKVAGILPGVAKSIGQSAQEGLTTTASGAGSAAGIVGDTTIQGANPLGMGNLFGFADKINDPSFWLRIGLVLLGFILLIVAISRMSGESVSVPGSDTVQKVASKKVPLVTSE
jgi:F0F1-type ATP synthase assembly protein I